MLRAMMQVFVKDSAKALEVYQKAFGAELVCAYPNEGGGYEHAELNVYGQILAVSELDQSEVQGNTMMFCFEFGQGGEEAVQTAYRVLREGAQSHTPIGPCGYSPYQFTLTDQFGVTWCLFV